MRSLSLIIAGRDLNIDSWNQPVSSVTVGRTISRRCRRITWTVEPGSGRYRDANQLNGRPVRCVRDRPPRE